MFLPNRIIKSRIHVTAFTAAALVGCGGSDDGRATMADATALVFTDSTHHVDALAREAALVEHPSGALFVSGYGDPGPKLWRSDDGGSTWERVFVGTEADGAVANSDMDLAVGPDGTLYFATMGYDRTVLEGTHIVVGVSHDVGVNWSWTRLSETRFDDRPWVAVAPDGTAHVIWNDGAGVCHAVSTDGGVTWTERPRIHPLGGSSHLAVGPNGEVAVRVVPVSASGNRLDPGVELVAVSTDGGMSWQKHEPPGERIWESPLENPDVPRWVEPLAWDAAGALYYLWSEGNDLWLGRSVDQGGTWTTWPVAQGDRVTYFPYLIARGPGELAATWFTGLGNDMQGHVALLYMGAEPGDAAPKVIRSEPFVPDSWGLPGFGDPEVRDTAGEYLTVIFLSDGGLAVVSTIQDTRVNRLGFSWWKLEAQ